MTDQWNQAEETYDDSSVSEQQEQSRSESTAENASNVTYQQPLKHVQDTKCASKATGGQQDFNLTAIGKESSTVAIGPRDYKNLFYRNAKKTPAPTKILIDCQLADFVLEYVADFISRQENKYRR